MHITKPQSQPHPLLYSRIWGSWKLDCVGKEEELNFHLITPYKDKGNSLI